MAVRTQHAASYYIWEVPGKPVVVHLHLDVVEGLLAVILRELEALPKRGTEVGGLLLGTIEQGNPAIVRVEDFEAVEYAYQSDGSVFTGADRQVFDAALGRWQPSDARPVYAVGFYRSHTADGLSLTQEDRELADKHFQPAGSVVLLVKPYRSRASAAGFFFREDGVFPEKTPLEFPFRRSDLSRDEAPPVSPAAVPPAPVFAETPLTASPKDRGRGAWWIALSFVFLLVGLGLGLTLPRTRGFLLFRDEKPSFSLGLSVSRPDENIAIKWDRQAPAIQNALQGSIEIVDGSETISRKLDVTELRSGNLIYRNISNAVKVRLIVFPDPRVSVTEEVGWPH